MPRNDYECPICHAIKQDVTTHVDAMARPTCDECSVPMEWLPTRSAVDAFTPFEVDLDGQTVHVESLRQVRQIEAESERRAREGTGQIYAFRAFSNDRSNQDANTFGRPHFPEFSTRTQRGEPFFRRRDD